MGMDGIEIVEETEERFGITISDAEAGEVVTVGDLFDLVLKKVTPGPSGDCMTRRLFYRLRATLKKVDPELKERLEPKTEMERVLPNKKRRRYWNRVSEEMRLKLPALRRPAIVVLFNVFLFFGLIMAGVFGAHWDLDNLMRWILALSSVPACFLIYYLTTPLAVYSPNRTLGGIVQDLLCENIPKLNHEGKHLNEQEIWMIVQEIVCEQLGVKKERVTKSARFIADLGL